ncbi:MAG TPA: hypothetical protein VL049_08215 [Candidatus Dormibacteraeota bacterium]|nr:hypothetical protein [Candidatus Dormibacteraeota bacterium]
MSPDAIAARLTALERSHRRLRSLVAALVVALLGAVVAGAGTDGVLVGRTLKLLDDQGRVRVLLTASSGISFLDAKGRGRAVLGLDGNDAPGLVLNGDDSRAILNVNPDGPALAMTGERGRLRAILALVKGQPGVVFFDREERERVRFAVDESGGGRGTLNGADGGPIWRIPDRD